MSIRTKIFLLVLVLTSILSALVLLNLRDLIITSYNKLEASKMEKNLDRLHQSLDAEVENISSKLADWANWDDAYFFMETHSKDFIVSNLQTETLDNLKFNYIMFFDNDKRVFEIKSRDYLNKGFFKDDLAVIDEFTGNQKIFNDSQSGVLNIQGKPLLFASKPILRSDLTGESHGYLVFAKYLDSDLEEKLSKIVSLPIEIKEDDHFDGDQILMQGDDFVIYLKGEKIEAIHKFKDFYNNDFFSVEIVADREIYAQGQATFRYFSIVFASSVVVYLLAIVLTITLFVINKISNLNVSLRKISDSGDLSQRVPVKSGISSDEIINLSQQINVTLSSLEKISGDKEWSKRYLDSAIAFWVVLDKESRILWINKKLADTLGKDKDLLLGYNWNSISELNFINTQGDSFESKLKNKDGAEFLVYWKKSEISIGSGEFSEVRYVFIGEDITTRKIAETELKEKNEELSNINRMLVGREIQMAKLKEELENYKNGKQS